MAAEAIKFGGLENAVPVRKWLEVQQNFGDYAPGQLIQTDRGLFLKTLEGRLVAILGPEQQDDSGEDVEQTITEQIKDAADAAELAKLRAEKAYHRLMEKKSETDLKAFNHLLSKLPEDCVPSLEQGPPPPHAFAAGGAMAAGLSFNFKPENRVSVKEADEDFLAEKLAKCDEEFRNVSPYALRQLRNACAASALVPDLFVKAGLPRLAKKAGLAHKLLNDIWDAFDFDARDEVEQFVNSQQAEFSALGVSEDLKRVYTEVFNTAFKLAGNPAVSKEASTKAGCAAIAINDARIALDEDLCRATNANSPAAQKEDE